MIYYAFTLTALLKSCLWRKDSVVAHCEVGLQTKVQGDGQEEEGWRLKNRRDTMQSVVKEEPLCRQGTPTSGFIVSRSVADPCFVHWSLQRPVVAWDTGTLRLGLPSGSNLKKSVMLNVLYFIRFSFLLVSWLAFFSVQNDSLFFTVLVTKWVHSHDLRCHEKKHLCREWWWWWYDAGSSFFFQFQEIISKNKTNPADKLSCKRS